MPFEKSAVIAYQITKTVEITNVFAWGKDYEALYHPGEQADDESQDS
ncbi:hypothetical protein [Aurantimonas sp. VKM B-3413]